jgi:hypothetical protein
MDMLEWFFVILAADLSCAGIVGLVGMFRGRKKKDIKKGSGRKRASANVIPIGSRKKA